MKEKRASVLLFLFYGFELFLLIGYIVSPMFNTVGKAFHADEGFTFAVFQDYLSKPNNLQVIRNTFKVGALSVLTCGLMGTTLALYLFFVRVRCISSFWRR